MLPGPGVPTMLTCRGRCICLALSLSFSLQPARGQPSPWSATDIRGQADPPLNSIVFANDRVGWISAGLNTLLKTVDGGTTWAVLQTNLAVPGTEVSTVWFKDQDRGWAVGAI